MSLILDLRKKTRLRRFAVFKSFVENLRNDVGTAQERALRVIDLGGTPTFWQVWWPVSEIDRIQITLVNDHAFDQDHRDEEVISPFIENQHKDATTLSAEDFQAYDVVFSNSFLEHLGKRTRQAALAEQIVASGRPYFMQVPNRFSPVDPHHPFAPFFGALPHEMRARMLTVSSFQPGGHRVPLETARRWQDTYAPLGLGDMRRLFPDATFEIERPLGIPMSILAYRGAR